MVLHTLHTNTRAARDPHQLTRIQKKKKKKKRRYGFPLKGTDLLSWLFPIQFVSGVAKCFLKGSWFKRRKKQILTDHRETRGRAKPAHNM